MPLMAATSSSLPMIAFAAHLRSSGNHKHTTVPDHMPSSHRRYADWTIDRIRRDAVDIGPATTALCDLILERRPQLPKLVLGEREFDRREIVPEAGRGVSRQ
jgi:transposase